MSGGRGPATLRELVEAGASQLRRGESGARENPRQEASVLLGAAVGRSRTHLIAHSSEFARPPEVDRFWDLVERRASGIPLQLLLGETEFHEVRLRVEAGVFIPRPETELLVEEAIFAVDGRLEARPRGPVRVLDLCTGTGAVALAVAGKFRKQPRVRTYAGDWSPRAVRLARRNAEENELEADIRRSDLFSAFADLEGEVDVLVSNPPYVAPSESETLPIEVRIGDPPAALFDPDGGTGFHRRIARRGRDFLAPGGTIALEIGETQGEEVVAILADLGYDGVTVLPDLAGRDRFVRGTRTGTGTTSGKGAGPGRRSRTRCPREGNPSTRSS